MSRDLASSDFRNSTRANRRKTHQGQSFYQGTSIHFPRADIVNHFRDGVFFLLYLVLHISS
jgi:hypothetical protein